MKRDYDKKQEELEKFKLKVLEEQFILDSQINIKSNMNDRKDNTFMSYEDRTTKETKDREKQYHSLFKQRSDLDADC